MKCRRCDAAVFYVVLGTRDDDARAGVPLPVDARPEVRLVLDDGPPGTPLTPLARPTRTYKLHHCWRD